MEAINRCKQQCPPQNVISTNNWEFKQRYAHSASFLGVHPSLSTFLFNSTPAACSALRFQDRHSCIKRERERSVERYTQLRGGTLPVMPVIEVCSRHTQPRPGKPWILFHAGLLNIIHM